MSGTSVPNPLALAPVELIHEDDRRSVVITWQFSHSAELVWRAISDPGMLARWAPHTANRNLSSVGMVTLTFLGDDPRDAGVASDVEVSGAVLVADEPSVLEHTWGDDALVWQLESHGGTTTLTLKDTLADPQMASAIAAGWHLCLEVAESIMDGHPSEPIRGREAFNHGWFDLNDMYAKQLGVEPSVVGVQPN